MAWSKAYENEKKANRYHSDMDNDRVQTYRRIVSTMFNDGVINMIGQSFCVSIGQLFMKWSFLIGSFYSILIGG
jgi:coenzyme F420-reducing hydrogenase alpha subunit